VRDRFHSLRKVESNDQGTTIPAMQPGATCLRLAAAVIGQSSREKPADSVLRDVLRSARGLSAADAGQVSKAVFAYYRWLKWLDPRINPQARIVEALRLAAEYARSPGSFADDAMVERAVPGWIAEHLEISPAWVRSLQTQPRLWLRSRPAQADQLAAELKDCVPVAPPALRDALEYRGADDLFRSAPFRAGQFEIQDLHSQAVSVICQPRKGEKWWDACAGEGGKTLHLSDLMENSGLILASDRAKWRLDKLRKRAARAKVFNYRVADWTGGERLPAKTLFDGVLVDAPCSGVGTWQRNPHARWTSRPEDILELARLQKQLLAFASRAVKPGGKLVYAVCTLTRDETIEVADSFERDVPGFSRWAFVNPLTGREEPQGWVMLRTEDTGGNGMFIAAWRAAL